MVRNGKRKPALGRCGLRHWAARNAITFAGVESRGNSFFEGEDEAVKSGLGLLLKIVLT